MIAMVWRHNLATLFVVCCGGVIQCTEVQVIKGDNLTLRCSLETGDQEVTWSKDGGIAASVQIYEGGSCDWVLTENHRGNIWISCSNNSVDLTELEFTTANWLCTETRKRKSSDQIKVTFQYGQDILMPDLKVDLETVIPGTTLALDCTVNVNVDRVIWYHNEVSVADIRRNIKGECKVVWHKDQRFSTSCEGNRTSLLISDAMTSDARKWYCYDSTHHIKSKKVNINVVTATEIPVLVASQKVASFGSHLNLTCLLPYISPLVRWTSDDHDFGDATVQYIGGCKFTSQQDLPRGFNYTCDKKTVSVAFTALPALNRTKWRCQDPYRKLRSPEVEVKITLPSVWPTDVDISGNRGSTTDHAEMTITCMCHCDHLFDFHWHYGNLTATVSHSEFDSTQYRCRQSLRLRPDWTYDGRTVRCLVTNTNTVKARFGQVQLEVEYPPIPSVALEFLADGGGTVEPVLICRVRANPGHVTFSDWKHMYNGELVRELEGEQRRMESRLRIPRPSFKDEGVYVCSVTNNALRKLGRDPIPSDITFEPRGAPVFLQTNVLSKQRIAASVTLTQRVISPSPTLRVTWLYKEARLLLPYTGYRQAINRSIDTLLIYTKSVEKEVFDIQLIIEEINKRTFGVYALEVCNELGCIKSEEIYINYIEPEKPEEEPDEVEEDSGPSLGYGQILAFCVGITALLLSILLLVCVVRRRRTLARRVSITQVNPDIVTEAAQVESATDSQKDLSCRQPDQTAEVAAA
ncbi:uncharacterized protein LOC124115341 [Haliotis rufescens]|uniref:uncharacterized protein LOC124115341 n=1 Tax=Haliotis rufescens TaxID=6454 RepID=UPI00201E75F7|nr:uncharacterized protein LOC124115341 [Haliotis rufescens]